MLNNKLFFGATYCLFLKYHHLLFSNYHLHKLLLITFYFFYEITLLEFYKNKIIIFLIFFSIYAALNGYLQIGDNLKYSSIFHIRYVFLSIAVFFILERNKKVSLFINNKFLKFFIVFLFFIRLSALFQFFNGKNIFGFEMYQGRVTGIFNDEAILGTIPNHFIMPKLSLRMI